MNQSPLPPSAPTWRQPEFWTALVSQIIATVALFGFWSTADAERVQDAALKVVATTFVLLGQIYLALELIWAAQQRHRADSSDDNRNPPSLPPALPIFVGLGLLLLMPSTCPAQQPTLPSVSSLVVEEEGVCCWWFRRRLSPSPPPDTDDLRAELRALKAELEALRRERQGQPHPTPIYLLPPNGTPRDTLPPSAPPRDTLPPSNSPRDLLPANPPPTTGNHNGFIRYSLQRRLP
jgi:hypothetical protein